MKVTVMREIEEEDRRRHPEIAAAQRGDLWPALRPCSWRRIDAIDHDVAAMAAHVGLAQPHAGKPSPAARTVLLGRQDHGAELLVELLDPRGDRSRRRPAGV